MIAPMTDWTFAMLGLAILAVWLPPLPLGRKPIPLWPFAFATALIPGFASGVLRWPALPVLAAFAGLVWAASAAPRGRPFFIVLAGAMAVALSVHVLPGFANPKVFDAERLTPDALPFTQYLNFDKGTAGLFLLAAFAPRVRRWREAGAIVGPVSLAAVVTTVAVIGLAVALSLVHVDPHWHPLAPTFLAVNLLFTCVAEEVFFRGLLQDRLPGPRPLAVTASALLFGLVHLPAGAAYAALATVLGLGCALVFERTRRIESAIAVHFAVNAVHFTGFTYPMLASA